jgi:hypothetical protein
MPMKKNLLILILLVISLPMFGQGSSESGSLIAIAAKPVAHGHQLSVGQDSLEKDNNKFNLPRYVLYGDTIRHKAAHSSWFIHSLYETVYFNVVEGFGLDLKADYNKSLPLAKSYTISPEVRYGLAANLFSVNTRFAYRYDPYNKGMFYGKAGSYVLDLNDQVNNSPFLNAISALFFKTNSTKLYRSHAAMLGMQRNVVTGLLLDGSIEYAKREQLYNSSNYSIVKKPDVAYTSNNPFKPLLPDTALLFRPNNAVTLNLSATYTFDEEYTRSPNGPVYKKTKYPTVKLSYRKGIRNLLGSDIDYDYADIQVYQDGIKIGNAGYSAFVVAAGKFLNTNALIYPDYERFKGNEGITFTPLVSFFHFLPYYTTATTGSFFEAHYEHNFSGSLINKVPILHKLKLEELAGAAYLSRQNTPGYTEFYIGLKKSVFRLDYGLAFSGGKLFKQGVEMYFGF